MTSQPYQGTQRSTSSITKESVYSRNAPPKQHSTNTTGSLTTYCTSTDTQKMASLKLSALRIAHETPSHRTQNGYISKSRSFRTDWTAKSQELFQEKTFQYTSLTNPTLWDKPSHSTPQSRHATEQTAPSQAPVCAYTEIQFANSCARLSESSTLEAQHDSYIIAWKNIWSMTIRQWKNTS